MAYFLFQEKPKIVKLYNSLKAGVDTLDCATGSYTCKRRTDRYPVAIFHNLLDLCTHNAFQTFLAANNGYLSGDRSKKRKFLDWLSKELAIEHVRERRNESGLQNEVVKKIDIFINNYDLMYAPTVSPTSVCSKCTSNDNLKICSLCKVLACPEHYRSKIMYACPECCKLSEEFQEIKHVSRKLRRCSFCPRNRDLKTMISCSVCNRAVCERHKERKVKAFDICQTCL